MNFFLLVGFIFIIVYAYIMLACRPPGTAPLSRTHYCLFLYLPYLYIYKRTIKGLHLCWIIIPKDFLLKFVQLCLVCFTIIFYVFIFFTNPHDISYRSPRSQGRNHPYSHSYLHSYLLSYLSRASGAASRASITGR